MQLVPFHNTSLQLLFERVVVEIAADDHQLVFAGAFPIGVIDREALSSQVEDMPPLAFLEPKNPLGAKDSGWQLVVEEVLKSPEA